MGLLQVGIACFHIIESGIESRIHSQVELLGGVILNGNPRCRSLRVVDEHIDSAELVDGCLGNTFGDGFVISSFADIGGKGEYTDAVKTLQLFLCLFQLRHIATCNHKICTFLRICGGNAVADRAASAV